MSERRGDFWPDLYRLRLSFQAEGRAYPSQLDGILREFDRFPPAIREELASVLADLSATLDDLANLLLEPRVQRKNHQGNCGYRRS